MIEELRWTPVAFPLNWDGHQSRFLWIEMDTNRVFIWTIIWTSRNLINHIKVGEKMAHGVPFYPTKGAKWSNIIFYYFFLHLKNAYMYTKSLNFIHKLAVLRFLPNIIIFGWIFLMWGHFFFICAFWPHFSYLHLTLLAMWLLIHAGIKVNTY